MICQGEMFKEPDVQDLEKILHRSGNTRFVSRKPGSCFPRGSMRRCRLSAISLKRNCLRAAEDEGIGKSLIKQEISCIIYLFPVGGLFRKVSPGVRLRQAGRQPSPGRRAYRRKVFRVQGAKGYFRGRPFSGEEEGGRLWVSGQEVMNGHGVQGQKS